MAYETFPKNGKMGSRRKFDTEMHKDGWDGHDNSKRDRMKSGRNAYAAKAQSNYKFKEQATPKGNPTRREYMKSGNKAQSGFGTNWS